MDLSRCHQLARYSWPRRSARRALPGKMCRRRLDWRAGGGLASPPTGCSCRRCRGSSRAQRAAASVGRSVPPPPGDSRRRRQRCLGVSYCVAACAQFVCPFSSNCSTVSVSASMKHHLQLHYRLVKFILLVPVVRTSAADPIMDMPSDQEYVIVAAISLLGTRGPATVQGVRCRARRAAARAPSFVCPAGRGIATNRSSCAAAAAVRSVPASPWGEARHPSTRTGRAAATGRLEAPTPSLPLRAAAGITCSFTVGSLISTCLALLQTLIR